jgi:pimeloyl-ACP methyl ester carboxylesterase
MPLIDGLEIGVDVVGEGDPVLLLHGWGVSMQEILPVAQRLSQLGFQCHSLDLPGFGSSQLPPQAWDVPRYAAFVKSYLEYAGLNSVHVIGHSFGGRISLVLGADYPDLIRKIVLVDSAGVPPRVSWQMKSYSLSRKVIFVLLKLPLLNRFEPAVRRWFWQRFGSVDAQAAIKRSPILIDTFKLVIKQDLLPYARRIHKPTLLVWGELDQDTPLDQAKILEEAIPDVGLVVFDGAGHYAYLDRLPEFVRIVTTFFKGS